MESSGQPPATRSSLVSDRLILRPVHWEAVLAITGGERLDDWADDYPDEGDVMIAGLLLGAHEAVRPEAGQAGQAVRPEAGQAVRPEAGQAAGAGRVVGTRAGRVVGTRAGRVVGTRAGRAGAAPGDEDWGQRQVVERASGLVVGGIGFFGPPRGGEVEIGYGIVPSRQGCGYATEALRAMIAMAWADARVTAVVAGTGPGNVASQRVLGKAGFRPTAATREFRYRLTRPA